MTNTGEKLEFEAREHFNEVALFWGEVGRIVGYGEDESDCYFIAQHMRPKGLVWHSCVGGFIALRCLKGQDFVRSDGGEEWDDYVRLDNLLALNGAPVAEQFLIEHLVTTSHDRHPRA